MSKKKKGVKEPSPPTNVSSPIRGANQDQSGYGVKSSVADYTISDETQYDEGFIAGVGAVRATPVQMNSTPRGKKERNSPRSSAGLQRAADKRRMQLDRVAQKRTQMQKKTKEKLIAKRQHNEELSLTNLAKKVGAESKAKMPNDKLTQSFKKFSDFVKENLIIDEGEVVAFNKKKAEKPREITGDDLNAAWAMNYVAKKSDKISYHDNGVKIHHRNGSSTFILGGHHPVFDVDHEGKPTKFKDNLSLASSAFKMPTVAANKKNVVKLSKQKTNEEVENLEEGRPKKNATSEDPGSEHIVMQLRKAISLRGQHPVKFVNGKSSLVSPATAHRLLTMHDNMKTAAEKDHFAKHIHKSVDHMRDALAGKTPEPEKKKISLGGSHATNNK